MLYVPAAAGVITGVVLLPPEVLLDDPPEPPQPVAPPMTPTERITANKVPQRRRRGSTRKNMQASVAPEPAMYQGVFVAARSLEAILSREVVFFALLWKADKVKVTEVGEFELRVMVSAGVEAGLKA